MGRSILTDAFSADSSKSGKAIRAFGMVPDEAASLVASEFAILLL